MNEIEITTREKVFALENEMLKFPEARVTIVPVHRFSPGVYAREITIPAGTLLTGEIHKYPQLNIMSKGDMSVLTEDGIVRVQAPFTVVSPAGTKRVAFAHTETVWTTILHTELTDVEQIENTFLDRESAPMIEG